MRCAVSIKLDSAAAVVVMQQQQQQQQHGAKLTSYWGFSERCAVPLNPSRAAAMVPMVTAMCSQVRKVLSLAKKVLGSIRMGVVLQGMRLSLLSKAMFSAAA